jgi:ATP-dependent DNA helicase RecQ
VLTDVSLQLGDVVVQRGPLMRETLALQTLRLPDQAARLAWLADHLPALPGTGIVYTLTKRDAEQVAGWLDRHGIPARAYYSDVTSPSFPDANRYRQHLEDMLLGNRLKALVATTALGMGYDKPDLGFVVHYQAPGSIVAYYQQVGRAGRAIDRAVGILFAGHEDEQIQEYFRSSAFPSEAHVNAVLDLLAEHDSLSIRDLESALNLRYGQIEKVLHFLSVESPAPVVKLGGRWRRTPVPYRLDHAHVARLTRQRTVEWAEVQAYVDSRECLMTFLARALDDVPSGPCGQCAVCLRRPVIAADVQRERMLEAARYLRHAELPLECNRQVAPNAFPTYGFHGNLPLHLRAETGRIVSRWGDAGWGLAVKEDKHAGRFRDALVETVVEMFRERWQPSPSPTWVTCVPSLLHPHLMPSFAQRVARALGIPFVAAIVKVRANQPQKQQQNRYHQCANLDGVFDVAADVPSGPVLLLDDVVDSAWTLTVCSALLRQAGAGPVWPVALAATSPGD